MHIFCIKCITAKLLLWWYGRLWFHVPLQIKKVLKGLRVEVAHRVEVRRKYRIDGLTKQSSRDLRFELSTGETKNVRDYFRETYKLQLRYNFLPCLQVGTEQKPNYLPMEVCANGGQVAAVAVW